jgi:HEXXH motif-containing protein
MPMDLTYPRPGSTTLRDLLPRVMTRLVQRYRALPRGEEGSLRAVAHEATRSLCGEGAAALGAMLMAPTCSVLLPGAARGDVGLSNGLDLQVLFALAGEGAIESDIVVRRPAAGWPRLLSISGGVANEIGLEVEWLEMGQSMVQTSAGGTYDPAAPESVAGLTVTEVYVPIVDGVVLALADDNPFTCVKLHPERDGNVLDLGGHDVDVWVSRLREAFALVAEHLPELYEEMRWLLRVIVPVGFHEERHASCSYEDAMGAIYLTLHPRPIKLAEAIVHEYQHNKLHAVMRLDPLLRDAGVATHASPLRPDARPLEGVLLAVHAFLPVSRMYRAVTAAGGPLTRSRDWGETCASVEAVHRDAAETLFAHAKPTKLGAALFAEMRALAK